MEGECSIGNWTEEVEDLVHEGEIDKAISVLETVVSKLEKKTQKGSSSSSSSSELAIALLDLSKLYSSKDLSLKADQTRSLALQINQESHSDEFPAKGGLNVVMESKSHDSHNEASISSRISENDWEAAADRAPDELISPQNLPEVSKMLLEDAPVQVLKRRGRGTFLYQTDSMYSEAHSNVPVNEDEEEKADCQSSALENTTKDRNYGTRHVLVLADFPPTTTTSHLENLFERFKDRGVEIRWVTDTVALAVFSSPSIALEASTGIKCPFMLRVLEDTDELLSSIPLEDLEPSHLSPETSPRTDDTDEHLSSIPLQDTEPPRLRPKTDVRTAQRFIAHGLGIKLSSELRNQEEASKNTRDDEN
ncbi:hypothetical protein ACH5RR_021221 [Cinchona calisaya]|uniref:Coiled-coil domain-containing protein R3HCC1L n=1 Tax=Cinchona calisaya TaxID=153742 RepID=A0ABD2ZJL1_9GENT